MLHLFGQKYSKNSKIILQFKITVFYLNTFKTRIYSCDVKADFQQQILLHSSVSNDPLEIDTRDTFLFINVENSFGFLISLVETVINFFMMLC